MEHYFLEVQSAAVINQLNEIFAYWLVQDDDFLIKFPGLSVLSTVR